MTDELTRSPAGWWLPKGDTVFENYASPPEFREGPPPKRDGFYRHHLLAAFGHVRAWDCAIDVGTHCGFWAYEMAQRFAHVHAFEPSPTNFQCLQRNMAEFGNVTLYHAAVGHEVGTCEIHNDKQRPGNSGSNYVVPGGGAILMRPLDWYEFDGCDFLKVDVEGFELRVLEGARQLIKRFRPVISMECTDFKFRDRYGIPEGQAERWLVKRGYRVAWAERPDKVFVPG